MAQSAVVARPRPEDQQGQGRQQQQQQQLFAPLGKPPLSPQLDSSLITSSVRKRKGPALDPPGADTPRVQLSLGEDGKRQRTPPVDRGLAGSSGGSGAGASDATVHLLVSPGVQARTAAANAATPVADERPQQPGPCQHPALQVQQEQEQQQQQQGQHAQQHAHHYGAARPQGQEEGLLFSPLFHLHREGSAELGGVSEAAAADAAAAAAATLGSPPPPVPAAAPGGLAPVSVGGQQRTDTEATSTDHSTGTSASLDMDADLAGAGACELAESSGQEGPQWDLEDDGEAAAAVAAALAPPPPPAGAADEGDPDADECLDFCPLLFIKRLPPLEACVGTSQRDLLLPRKTRRSPQKTLVLDLDETLVHSTLDGYCRPDFTFPVEVGSMRHMVSVRQRPHLHTFLERAAELFEVVVFTASQRVYAEQLLNIVDPQRRLVRHRVFRESCVLWEGNYLKDLTVLGRDLAHTIIVDNSPQAFGFQLDNGIPIESWYDDDGDEELLKLLPFLERVAHAGVADVRPHIQRRYRLRSLVEAAADPDAELYQHHYQQQGQQQAQAEQAEAPQAATEAAAP